MTRYLLLAAGLAITPTLAAQQTDDFRWSGRLASGKTLEVQGVNGEIRATAASGDLAEVTATKHARRSDPEEVEIRVVEHADGVTICAVYPSTGRRENTCEPGGGHNEVRNNDVVVDFEVRVPRGVAFAGHTVNGGVEATDLPGDARVGTVNGSVEVSAAGLVEASSVNGGIRATMRDADWRGSLRFHTVNGDVDLALPASAAFEVDGSTVNGALESDFPITIRGRWGPRRMTGTVNGGGRTLDLETVNGDLRLRRL